MRHRKNRHNLNRFTSWRKATLISISRSLLIHQRIETTKTKAKAAQPLVEKLISLGKRDNLPSRRKAFDILQDHQLVKMLFSDIAPRFHSRIGGYSRILPMGFRRGDGAVKVIFELTEKRLEEKPTSAPVKKETVKATKQAVKKPSEEAKPGKKFLGGLRKIFKKSNDSV